MYSNQVRCMKISTKVYYIGLVWRRESGLFITTTSGSGIRRCRFTRAISLPVMSDVTVPLFYWRIARLLILPRGGGLLLLCQYLVKRQDLPPLCPLSVILQAVPEMMLPLHSKIPGTLYSSLEDWVVAAAG